MFVMNALLTLLTLALFLSLTHAQPPKPNGVDSNSLLPVQPFSQEYRIRLRRPCGKDFRKFSGTCTSIGSNQRKLWGSSNRPQFSYFSGRDNLKPRGEGLPSARQVSNQLFAQTMDVFDERRLSEITTFLGQFVDHTIVATPTNKKEHLDIEIPPRDVIARAVFRNGTLPFFRSTRVRVRERDNEERPQNTLSSAVDMTNVYGPTKLRNNALRTGRGGLMRTSGDNLLPLNERTLNNAPKTSRNFFLAGDHRVNEHPVLTSLHTIFMREHNLIAAELAGYFPKFDDEQLFQEAKKINEAQFQKIVFEEWYPAITGTKLPKYRGFKRTTDPTVSVTFSTAAFRIGHTLVGDKVNRLGPNNSPLRSFSLSEMFFRDKGVFERLGIDSFLRGAINNRAQKVDLKVHDSLRNNLFKGIDGEKDNFDLIALNIQRGRDHALASYNAIRVRFKLPKRTSFSLVTKDRNTQSSLQTVYGSPEKIEAFPGLLAEDHVPNSSFGETLLKVWTEEFRRLRDGDRFYFRNKGVFSTDFVERVPRLKNLLSNKRKDVFRDVLLANTDISQKDLPKRLFFVD